jgi:hypothetical protein
MAASQLAAPPRSIYSERFTPHSFIQLYQAGANPRTTARVAD